MRLCMQRAVPVRLGPPIALPAAETPDDARRAIVEIVAAPTRPPFARPPSGFR
jgi:hypothetical protein